LISIVVAYRKLFVWQGASSGLMTGPVAELAILPLHGIDASETLHALAIAIVFFKHVITYKRIIFSNIGMQQSSMPHAVLANRRTQSVSAQLYTPWHITAHQPCSEIP
jgi:hypothetical protein